MFSVCCLWWRHAHQTCLQARLAAVCCLLLDKARLYQFQMMSHLSIGHALFRARLLLPRVPTRRSLRWLLAARSLTKALQCAEKISSQSKMSQPWVANVGQ